MATLADLPPEILDHILWYKNISHFVVNLWKIGNRRLNMVLANGGVTTVKLMDDTFNSTSRFPKMLLQLRSLRKLKILKGSESFMDAFELGSLLRQLTPKLEELTLHFKEAEMLFLEDSFDSMSLLDLEPSSEVVQESGVHAVASRMWNIGAVFPNLKRLELWGDSCFENADFAVLPSGLTCLKLLNAPEGTFNNTAILPRSLLSLHMGMCSGEQHFPSASFQNLPPGLTVLDAQTSFNRDVDYIAQLPRTLTDIPSQVWSLTTTSADKIPPNLTSLDLEQISCPYRSWPELLPSKITYLDISSIDPALPVNAAELRLLPRTIVQLMVGVINWDSEPTAEDFPPNLWRFQMDESRSMRAEHWGLLPKHSMRNVTGVLVDSSIVPHDSLDYIFALPKLRMLRCSLSAPPGKEEITLPKIGLDLLHFANLSLRKCVIDSLSIRERMPLHLTTVRLTANPLWEPEDFKGFPSTLTSLSIVERSIRAAFLRYLPSKLERIYIAILEATDNADDFSALPSSLQDFSVSSSNPTVPIEAFKHFPRNMTSLDWEQKPGWAPEVLSFLPPALTYLSVYFTEFRDHHVKMLPRSLRRMRYRVFTGNDEDPSPPQLTAAAAPFFPERLGYSYPWNFSRCDAFTAYRSIMQERMSHPIQTPDPRVLERHRRFLESQSSHP